jgi:hypothetical protein
MGPFGLTSLKRDCWLSRPRVQRARDWREVLMPVEGLSREEAVGALVLELLLAPPPPPSPPPPPGDRTRQTGDVRKKIKEV